MPATYRHVHKFSSNRSAWQKPESAKTHTQKKFYILGVEVDRETYWEHEKALYELSPGYRVPLYTVQRLAETKDLSDRTDGERLEIEAARKIIAQIRAEITGEEEKQMSKEKINKRYMATLEELSGIYEQGKEKLAALKGAYKAAESEYNYTVADSQATDLDKRLAKLNFEKAKEAFSKGMDALMMEQTNSAAEARKSIAEYADQYFLATPDQIDSAAMQLLQSGAMNTKDIRYMAEQQKDNPTMLRVIASYVDRAASREENRSAMLEYKSLSASLNEMTSPAGFLDKVDAMARVMKNAVTENEFMAEGWDKMFNQFMQEAQTAYAEQSEA